MPCVPYMSSRARCMRNSWCVVANLEHCEIAVAFECPLGLWEALYGLKMGRIELGYALGEASLILNFPKFYSLNGKSRCNATTFCGCVFGGTMKDVTFLELSKNVTLFYSALQFQSRYKRKWTDDGIMELTTKLRGLHQYLRLFSHW